MRKNKDVLHYSAMSKVLHWVIALLVLGLGIAGFLVMPNLSQEAKPFVYMVHKSLGLMVLSLMLLRLGAILYYGRPSLLSAMPRWEHVLSKTVQYGFYVLLILMPLSGWLMSCFSGYTPVFFGLFPLSFPGVTPNKFWAEWFLSCHETLAWSLLVFIVLHVSGALKHQFIDQDGLLRRMWFK